MKLAKAAAQQLKGVVIEYDVLCSTLLGKSAAEQAEQTRRKQAAQQARQQREQRFGSSLFGPSSIQSMLVGDVRGLLKELNEDSTGKPWAVKERLQSTLQGLPSQILDRVTGSGDKQQAAAGKSEDEIYLEKQLQSASEELARMKQRKEEEREEREQWSSKGFGVKSGSQASSLRDKYMDKINRLKEKKKQESASKTTGMDEVVGATTSAGLSTWVVNDGANEVLSYSDLRGLFKAVIPPSDPLQDDEYNFFLKEMEGQFDMFLPKAEQAKFPDPKPILHICDEFGLKPADVLVLARHAPTIKAAKAAGTHVCHYMPGDKAIPNHTAHYHLTHLSEFQHLVEDFNGVSYRDKIKMGSIEF
ncbi:HAD-like domain [Phytophthora cinnamomi]|uniref:HAD-like domain n=1 Tax=Phytophthora cinnamomi TaxID=4785 RepID=UPI0035599C29|nr:HAD-like domain [Phytophthora cinnamomi]